MQRCRICKLKGHNELTFNTPLNAFGKKFIPDDEAAENERTRLVRDQQAAERRLSARAHGLSQHIPLGQNSGHDPPNEELPSSQIEPPPPPVAQDDSCPSFRKFSTPLPQLDPIIAPSSVQS